MADETTCPNGCCTYNPKWNAWERDWSDGEYEPASVEYCQRGGQRLNDDGTITEMVPKEAETDGDD